MANKKIGVVQKRNGEIRRQFNQYLIQGMRTMDAYARCAADWDLSEDWVRYIINNP